MNLQPGDEAFIKRFRETPRLVKVLRVSPTGRITVEHGMGEITFNADGSMRGNHYTYDKWRLVEPTPELRDQVLRVELTNRLLSARWQDLTTKQLQQIVDML